MVKGVARHGETFGVSRDRIWIWELYWLEARHVDENAQSNMHGNPNLSAGGRFPRALHRGYRAPENVLRQIQWYPDNHDWRGFGYREV